MPDVRHHALPELDAKGLRHFGITTGLVIGVLFGFVLPWLAGAALPWWPWALCAVLVLWGLVLPTGLRPVYRGWMRFGLLMSRVTTPIILGLAFGLVVTPFALVRRLLGRDSMTRKLDPDAQSYRVPSREAPKRNMERPF